MPEVKPDHPHPSSPRILTSPKLLGGLRQQAGKVGWIFLWLIGVPVPILLGLFLLRGCT